VPLGQQHQWCGRRRAEVPEQRTARNAPKCSEPLALRGFYPTLAPAPSLILRWAMVWRCFARVGVPSVLLGLAVNCSVDEEGYVFDDRTSNGTAGEKSDGADTGQSGSGGAAAGGKSFGGQPNAGDAGNRSEGNGGASGRSDGSRGGDGSSAAAGINANAGGAANNPGNGGSPTRTGGSGGTATSAGASSVGCDCDDPDCGAHVCVPAAPGLWSGPLLLFEGAKAWLPECNGEAASVLFDAGTVPLDDELRCYGCGCGELMDGDCTLPYTLYTDSSCKNSIGSGILTETCASPAWAGYFTFDVLQTGGGCLPSGGEESSRAGPRWDNVARGCGLSDAQSRGCGDGSICMPEPVSPFEDQICVYRAGEHDCPSGYPNKRSYSMTLKDERECAPCSCVPSGTCNARLTAYNNDQCMVAPPSYTSEDVSLAVPGTCRSFDAGSSIVGRQLTSIFLPGNCSPYQPSPTTGSIRAEDPITVCCE
jgi:hypothetical protein